MEKLFRLFRVELHFSEVLMPRKMTPTKEHGLIYTLKVVSQLDIHGIFL